MEQENISKLISEMLAIEAEEAKQAGALGYMARTVVQATLPHRRVKDSTFKRVNGNFKLLILADPEIGLPYGSIPRLLLAWIVTEAVRTKNRELLLGSTLSQFMEQLGLVPTGGRWGTITRLKEQMQKLFSASFSCTYDDGDKWAIRNVNPVNKANLWWDLKQPSQMTFFDSTLTLGEDFFSEIIRNPVPVDMRVLKAIKQSPLALDIYCWVTYRMYYLKKKTAITWGSLQLQFGADYQQTPQGVRDFKKAFIRELKKIQLLYNTAKISVDTSYLILEPSSSHIALR